MSKLVPKCQKPAGQLYTTYSVPDSQIRLDPDTGNIQVLNEYNEPIITNGGIELPEVQSKPNFWEGIINKAIKFITPEDSYKNEQVDYDDIINVSNGAKGQRFRSEMMGMHRPDEYYPYPYFENPNYKAPDDEDIAEILDFVGEGSESWSRKLRGCSKNANKINSYYRRPTAGHAWTRHGIYGDSVIVVNPNVDKRNYNSIIGKKFNFVNKDNGDYVDKHIDEHDLKSGDIVDLYYSGTHSQDQAYSEGDANRANTHTGTIVRTGKGKNEVYVAHDLGKGLIFQPINELIGTGITKSSYITGIRRPGTKKHPYVDDKNKITYDKR